ncbi:hypothetical protein [Spelaeicoccus albus]|nr:hypothetical protein [Spelaeicoccus albus]
MSTIPAPPRPAIPARPRRPRKYDWVSNSYFDQLRQAREAAADVLRRTEE